MNCLKSILVPAFAGLLLVAAGEASAHGKKEHAAGKAAAPGDSAKAAAMTAREGMKGLIEHLGAMEKEIGAGKLDAIHDLSETLPASVKGLDEDSTLTEDKKKRVQGYVKNVLKLNDKLHHSADDKNLEQARKDLAKLKAQVQLLEKQFAASAKP